MRPESFDSFPKVPLNLVLLAYPHNNDYILAFLMREAGLYNSPCFILLTR